MPLRELHEKFNFTVAISGFDESRVFFQSCSALEAVVGTETFGEGGALNSLINPTSVEPAQVTLSWGASRDLRLYQWMCDVMAAAQGSGNGELIPLDYERTVHIHQRDRSRENIIKSFTLYQCFPTRILLGDWGPEDAVVIESITLSYRYLEVAIAETTPAANGAPDKAPSLAPPNRVILS